MTRLQSYTQKQLVSSVVGVPGADRSGEILAAGLQKVTSDFANFQIQNLQRRTAAEDTLAINAIRKSRDFAKDKMVQFMVDNPDPATWENGWNTVVQEQQKEFIGKTLTRSAAANERVNQKAFELGGKQLVQTATTEKTIDNAIKVTDDNLFDIRSNPFSTEEQVSKATAESKKELLTRHTEDVADIILEENLSEAGKEEIVNINKIGRNLITSPGSDPDIFEKATNDEIRSMLPNGHKIPNSDIEALRKYAGTVGNEIDAKSEKLRDETVLVERGKIRDAAPGKPYDLDAASDSIELDPDMTTPDKIKAQDDIKSYYKTYNSAVSDKVVTSDEARMAMNKLRQKIKRGDTTDTGGFYVANNAFTDYKKLKSKQKINTVDNKAFLNNIFKDEESARDVRVAKIATIIDKLENQIRDAIEKQPNFLGAGPIDEILKDFANEATIIFTDKFIDDTPETFKREEADAENARLIQKFTLSQGQQSLALNTQIILQAESLKEQQVEIKKSVTLLQNEGKIEEAKQIMEEAQRLGIPLDGENVKGDAKKTGNLKNILKLIIENL